ncbi:MAG: phosphohydrolase [Bdellovibrionaceae bacterium]|nr:phosphohydrolase [Pseudobdellovibrionaceae bacterium]
MAKKKKSQKKIVSKKNPHKKSVLKKRKSPKKQKILDTMESLQKMKGEVGELIYSMQEKVRQLELLTEFSGILNSTLDTDRVREKALEATCQLIGCETASLLLVDRDTGELYWETALGDSGQTLKKTIRLPIDNRSIAGYVAMTGESIILNDVEKDQRHNKAAKKKTGFVTRNMICIPIKTKNRVLGVLQALNKLPTIPPRPSTKEWTFFYQEDLKLLETLGHQVAIAVENSGLYGELKQSFYDTVEALAEAIEKKDRYTGGHTKRVVYYSMCIAKYLPLSEEQRERIRLGAILHDVGKIGIEDKILKKAAPLDPYEWPIMKEHPEHGYEIMKRVKGLKDVLGGMRYHHERWDGKGYPSGLQGEEIPLVARIIAVADTYDAMVSTRPYRKGLPPQVAYDEILKNSGTQFCPSVVEAFLQAFENEKMGRGSGGANLSNNLSAEELEAAAQRAREEESAKQAAQNQSSLKKTGS